MKYRSMFASIRPNGILRWSTACILFGGGLGGCNRDYVVTEKDSKMAEVQSRIEVLDSQKALLQNGEVANNFHIPGVGYYHADVHDFFEHSYGLARDERFFVDGEWGFEPGSETVLPSRPSPEALKKVDDALAREQELAKSNGGSQVNHHHGGGMGNMLMMYWLLSGNRGMFSPGAGFQQAGRNAGNWQNQVDTDRRNVSNHAAANPGYARAVEQSKAKGTPVRPGQSVRGGFGSSGRGPSGS